MKATSLESVHLAYLQAKRNYVLGCKKWQRVYGDACRDLLNALESEGLYDPMFEEPRDDDKDYEFNFYLWEMQQNTLDSYTRDDEEEECWDDDDCLLFIADDNAPCLSLSGVSYEESASVKNRQPAVIV